MDAGAKLQALYDAEVNFSISTFWDTGFTAKLGDPMNGWTAEGEFRTFDEAADWLVTQANAIHTPTTPDAETPTPRAALRVLPPTAQQRAAAEKETS